MFIKDNVFNFKPVGHAIKKARKARKITREKLAEKFDMDVRYLARIENEGINPGFALFYILVTMFDISVDQYFYPEKINTKSTTRRQIERIMDSFDEADLVIMETVAIGIYKSKEMRDINATKTPMLKP